MSYASGAVEIIGAVAMERAIDPARILSVLSATPEELTHGGRFTGRPGTCVLCADSLVVKLRAELCFSARDARHWCERTLERERRLGAHHPQKTWFLVGRDAQTTIGSVTPLLEPLHQLGPVDGDRLLHLLGAIVDRCIEAGARHDLRR